MKAVCLLFVAALPCVAETAAAQRVAPAVVEALRAWDPVYRVSGDPALVGRGDFDGDGRADVVAIVNADAGSALLAFHAGRDGWRVIPLYDRLPDGAVDLHVLPAGRYPVVGARTPLDTSRPTIELVFPGRSSALYVWEGTGYRAYGTESYFQLGRVGP